MTDLQLQEILATAARNNAKHKVTGMLLYAGGSFMQTLEGVASTVDKTFADIAKDPRHHSIVLLLRDQITERHFLHWHMGFRRLGPVDALQCPSYAPFFAKGFNALTIGAIPGLALEMLRDFAVMQRD